MRTILVLSLFIVITCLAATVSAQISQTTDPKTGDVTTTWSSDKYGGGTQTTLSDKKGKLRAEVYKDKCGIIREKYYGVTETRYYYDEYGKDAGRAVHKKEGDEYYSRSGNQFTSADGKAYVAKLEKAPAKTPCPEGATGTAGEKKPKEQPQPKIKPETPGGAFSPSLTPPSTEQGLAPGPFNWKGPYMGIQFGYTRTSSDYSLKLGGLWNDFPDVRNEIEFQGMHEFDESGFGLGGCAGYNWQFNNNVVIGVGVAGRKFWGLDAMHETGDFPADDAGDFDVWSSFRTTGIVTFGPKAGYACGRFLPYVSGGLAFGELDASQKIFSSTFGIHEVGKDSELRLGWNVAAGVQYAFTNNWSVRMEYSYSDLGTFKYPGQSFPDTFHGFGTWHMATVTEHGANFGIVYTFH